MMWLAIQQMWPLQSHDDKSYCRNYDVAKKDEEHEDRGSDDLDHDQHRAVRDGSQSET